MDFLGADTNISALMDLDWRCCMAKSISIIQHSMRADCCYLCRVHRQCLRWNVMLRKISKDFIVYSKTKRFSLLQMAENWNNTMLFRHALLQNSLAFYMLTSYLQWGKSVWKCAICINNNFTEQRSSQNEHPILEEWSLSWPHCFCS